MPNPHRILIDVIAGYDDSSKWKGQPFEAIKRLSNTKVGDVGQDFVERLCSEDALHCAFPEGTEGRRNRRSPWDICIEGMRFELKTATEDVGGSFQFNHIRYHRDYDALLCIGIAPSDIFTGAWTKAQVTTQHAGRLVPMDKGTSATYKLTKRPTDLSPIDDFATTIRDLVALP